MFTDHWPRYEDHLTNKTSYLVNLRVVLLPKVHNKKDWILYHKQNTSYFNMESQSMIKLYTRQVLPGYRFDKTLLQKVAQNV